MTALAATTDRSLFANAEPLVAALALCYAAVFIVSVLTLVMARRHRTTTLLPLGAALLALAFLLNTWVIIDRWLAAGRAPFKTLYETMLLYPWCIALVTFLLIGLHRLYVLVPFAAGASLAGLVYAMARPDLEIITLPPALQSVWFVPHVVTYFVAYAGLFAAFVLATLALIVPLFEKRAATDQAPRAAHPSSAFERQAHDAVMFGFAALTLGLVMGAIWGKFAWGDYWSWDAKENWALVTWLAYLVYLHMRLVKGWAGRRSMVVCVLSFATVVFTYLGMHLLPAAQGSLHVYQ